MWEFFLSNQITITAIASVVQTVAVVLAVVYIFRGRRE